MEYYEHRHVVSFEETNLLGNVYYAHPIRWQGRVRELFLRDHCPELLAELEGDLALITVHCSCDYLDQLKAFDQVLIRLRLGDLTQSRLTLLFEYWRRRPGTTDLLVARGEQRVVCMRRQGKEHVPTAVPPSLRDALQRYGT